jgi:hypothetical protein
MADTKRGRLAVAEISEETATIVYSVTDEMDATVDIFFSNIGASNCVVYCAIVDSDSASSLANEDYVMPPRKIAQGGYHRISDVEMSANESVLVYSDQPGIIVRVSGVEQDTTDNTLEIRKLTSQALAYGSFTDNEDATGYIDFTTGSLPAGAIVLGWKATVTTGFSGDTTAVVQVGVSGDVDAFSADTAQSCLAAATVGSASLASASATPIASATTPRVTVTGASDWGNVSAGSMVVDVYYMPTIESAVSYGGDTYDIQKLTSQSLAYGSFTDNTNATGYIDFTSGQLPAGAIVLGWKATVTTGFSGDTTATMMVGISGDTDAFSANTAQSCLAAGTIGSASLAATAALPIATAQTPRVTVTGGSDFTSISAGVASVEIYYILTD